METPKAAEQALRELQRAELVAHTRYPRLGRWYPPAVGAAGAFYVSCWALHGVARALGFLTFAVVVGLGAGAYIRLRGVNPRLQSAPPALKHEMRWFAVCFAVIIAAVTVLFVTLSWQVAAAAAFVAIAAFIARYEHRYARAAKRSEDDSGLFDAAS
jgi:hypothetical protein